MEQAGRKTEKDIDKCIINRKIDRETKVDRVRGRMGRKKGGKRASEREG